MAALLRTLPWHIACFATALTTAVANVLGTLVGMNVVQRQAEGVGELGQHGRLRLAVKRLSEQETR